MGTTTHHEDLEKAIMNYMDTNKGSIFTEAQILHANENKNMDTQETWMSIQVVPTTTVRTTIAGDVDKGISYRGEISINFYRLQNKGTKTLKQKMDDIADLFRGKAILVTGSYYVKTFVPYPSIMGKDGNWWVENLSIPYLYFR